MGKTDQETADTVGVRRETVWSWRREHPIFMSTLERRRAEVWGTAGERLRSLMQKRSTTWRRPLNRATESSALNCSRSRACMAAWSMC